MIFYEITPVDTLFFRGAEPLEAGQYSSGFIFPPPVSTISGAIRTRVLNEKNIDFEDFKKGNMPNEIRDLVGEYGNPKAPFDITMILLKKGSKVYAPAPYSWFKTSAGEKEREAVVGDSFKVISAGPIPAEIANSLGISSSSLAMPFVSSGKEIESLGGGWIRLELLGEKLPLTIRGDDFLHSTELFVQEDRTGISLLDNDNKPSRTVRDGVLFSAYHVRLLEEVSIIIGINKECGLSSSGLIFLGGERRSSKYQRVELSIRSYASGMRYVALAPVQLNSSVIDKIFCSGKPQLIAGWNMAKGFHKPGQSWLPAGTVFNEKIGAQCVTIA